MTTQPAELITLSLPLKACADSYVEARKRAGQAIVDQAHFMAQARALAKHGEWGTFLEYTQTSATTAARLLDIHARVQADKAFERAIRSDWLSFSAAAELAPKSVPDEVIARAIEAPERPTVEDVKVIKSTIMGDLTQDAPSPEPDLPIEYALIKRRLAALGVELVSNMQGTVRMYITRRAGTPTGIATPTWANVLDRLEYLEQAGAADERPDLVVEQRSDPNKPDPKEPPAQSDRAAYLAIEAADRDLLAMAEMEIAAGNVHLARQLLGRVQVSTWQRDQLLAELPAAPDPSAAARAFVDAQRAWLLGFSAHAMVSQAKHREALDHIDALLQDREVSR